MEIIIAINKAAQRHGYKTCFDFEEYLRETLIPDLIEAGKHETAQDFRTALDIIVSAKTAEFI